MDRVYADAIPAGQGAYPQATGSPDRLDLGPTASPAVAERHDRAADGLDDLDLVDDLAAGRRALTLDARNEGAGWVDLAEARAGRRPFAVPVADGLVGLDVDELTPATLCLLAALDPVGVPVASGWVAPPLEQGGPPQDRRHLWLRATLDDPTREGLALLGVTVREGRPGIAHGARMLRPPGSPHRYGLSRARLLDVDVAEARARLKRDRTRELAAAVREALAEDAAAPVDPAAASYAVAGRRAPRADDDPAPVATLDPPPPEAAPEAPQRAGVVALDVAPAPPLRGAAARLRRSVDRIADGGGLRPAPPSVVRALADEAAVDRSRKLWHAGRTLLALGWPVQAVVDALDASPLAARYAERRVRGGRAAALAADVARMLEAHEADPSGTRLARDVDPAVRERTARMRAAVSRWSPSRGRRSRPATLQAVAAAVVELAHEQATTDDVVAAVRNVAEAAGVGRSTAARALVELVDEGVLVRTTAAEGTAAARYRLNDRHPALAALDPDDVEDRDELDPGADGWRALGHAARLALAALDPVDGSTAREVADSLGYGDVRNARRHLRRLVDARLARVHEGRYYPHGAAADRLDEVAVESRTAGRRDEVAAEHARQRHGWRTRCARKAAAVEQAAPVPPLCDRDAPPVDDRDAPPPDPEDR